MLYEVQNLTFSYPGTDRRVLDGVSLHVGEGDLVTVLGRNGAGKSTLLGLMLGLLKPKSGRMVLTGRNLEDLSERDIASVIGFVPQAHVPTFSFSVLEFVMMGCAPRIGFFSKPGKRERDDSYKALEEFGIEELADRPYTQISGGERQRAMIARAVVSNPRAVFFDEPTAHLDYGGQLHVLKTIKALCGKGYSVVMTTHNPDHSLILGGKAVLIGRDGTFLAGDAEGIVTQDNLSDVYGVDIHLEYIESLGRKVCVYSSF